ncbi:adenylate/guanylate cyclase domain-containing protein [Bradyrhizobium sp. JYMT SZCCT0180]|uniref:adenylate/guanylate cyclase domain-containing protein n=1 Tax=Bradyrhizobium sp. JYMT SZCCT0180 TaxID=2807666 RepID=UPI001BAB5F34|nr:adenylate/guanylate cyclase domain-containing protein [Bradyrhizobium sp. JYMT SZCCT0180]MBR1212611.1 adenylate/guanylate cyclase domain-containing protein [Bradyrhizobium sp. JYMT SZCCT0180]
MNDERVERRLAAVLAADVAGYSRLMGADEEGTLSRLKAVRKGFVDSAVASHRGRLVKTTGDGMLVEFASAVDAVRSAIEMQRRMAEQNAAVPQDKRIEFRVGIHVGDIIIDDSDIFGDGVNIAARLEGLAEPGGVCISGAAYDQVRDKVPFSFVDLGNQTLKNIARPVSVYSIAAREMTRSEETIGQPNAASPEVHDRSDTPASVHSAGERGTRPSLAVLPFDNLSHDTEMEGFCDGLVEDAITALSKFRWLNVVSRNSSFAQKGRSVDIRRIARDIGVRFVVEGSVRKVGTRIRTTAQLIDGISGNHIWADRYDRDYSAAFDLQDEIVRDIVASLEYTLWITLVRGDVGAPNSASSPLRAAGWHIAECTHTGNRIAIACANRALEANPKSVAAYQYLANAYIVELMTGWSEDQADAGLLLEAARKATSLSPGDHLSQGLHAVGLAFVGDHDEALAYARRALALNSNSITVLGPCGNVLSFAGETREANEILERMLRLAPAHYFRAGFLSQMALNWLCLGDPERGSPLVSEALKLKPEAICCHVTHAKISASLGRHETAQAAISAVYRCRPDINRSLINVMFPHRDRSIPSQLAGLLGIT